MGKIHTRTYTHLFFTAGTFTPHTFSFLKTEASAYGHLKAPFVRPGVGKTAL